MFSSNVLNTMFNITAKDGYSRRLEANASFDAQNAYEKNSLNISDINSTFFEMYIIPAEDRHLGVDNFPL